MAEQTADPFDIALARMDAASAKRQGRSLLWVRIPIERLERDFGARLWFREIRGLWGPPANPTIPILSLDRVMRSADTYFRHLKASISISMQSRS